MAIFSAIAYGIAYASAYLAAAAGISVATAVTIGMVAGYVGTAIVAVGIARMLRPNVSIPRADIQATLTQSEAPRRVYVGQYLAGGVRAFYDVKSGVLHQIILVAHGSLSESIGFWIDGRKVGLVSNQSGAVSTKPYWRWTDSSYCYIYHRLGKLKGGDYTTLSNLFADWDETREIQKQATMYVRMFSPKPEDFNRVWPKGSMTEFQWEFKGQALYDPRSEDTGYSDNAALVTTHYLTHDDGYRLTESEVNWDSVSAMADVADEAVPQKGGGTAPSLRLWGYWTLDESPRDVLDRMHSSSGIRAYEMQDGRIGLIGGNFGEPACTLTGKDIRQIQTSEAINERQGYNVLRVFHLDGEQKYDVIEVDPWKDHARLAIEGEIVEEYRMEMCPDISQARRLAKKQIHDDNRAKVEIITNLVGLKARYPARYGQRHTILLDYRPEDGSGRVIQGEYEVMDHEFDPVNLECRIELLKVDRASEAWDPQEEGGTTEALPEPERNPPPDIDAVLTQRIVHASAGQRLAVLEVEAVPLPDREDVKIQARYRKVGDEVWTAMTVSEFIAQSGAVEDGMEYEAQARFSGIFDELMEWEDLGSVTIQIDNEPPGRPSELIPSNGNGYVHLSWRNPEGEFYKLRVYRSTGSSFSSAALVGTTGGAAGQISEYEDASIGSEIEYNYWVAAANVSGVEGDPAGPANIITT